MLFNIMKVVKEIISELFKPYLVCTCGNFRPVGFLPDRLFYICQCGGWMSLERLKNEKTYSQDVFQKKHQAGC